MISMRRVQVEYADCSSLCLTFSSKETFDYTKNSTIPISLSNSVLFKKLVIICLVSSSKTCKYDMHCYRKKGDTFLYYWRMGFVRTAFIVGVLYFLYHFQRRAQGAKGPAPYNPITNKAK